MTKVKLDSTFNLRTKKKNCHCATYQNPFLTFKNALKSIQVNEIACNEYESFNLNNSINNKKINVRQNQGKKDTIGQD